MEKPMIPNVLSCKFLKSQFYKRKEANISWFKCTFFIAAKTSDVPAQTGKTRTIIPLTNTPYLSGKVVWHTLWLVCTVSGIKVMIHDSSSAAIGVGWFVVSLDIGIDGLGYVEVTIELVLVVASGVVEVIAAEKGSCASDLLSVFPPTSVQLRRPFAVQPWDDSEENIGNLLMVWRFLITFADVLQLWLLLLMSLSKLFMTMTPSLGLGTNQNTAAGPEGGHPHIVEGAYAWGFDIRNWQRHLNPLTWPEILRQFALSAGFGPQLKKRSSEWSYSRENNEVQFLYFLFLFSDFAMNFLSE
ncbi:Homeobox-DDT domain protein RLT1 [Vitis vinifera]|uniref:Homeobox-DDT domain protein RLT1 n=1 Tax=Vitis vinifera TaxID=29760 RepID=A0A438IGI4_VITVI|nr:Homeobox-DDT domain protein RLT1 [Vitis vinifera]